MRAYVLNKDKVGVIKNTQYTNNRRIKEDVKYALEDLVLVSENLTEDMQKTMFNENTIGPFLRSVLSLDNDSLISEKDREKRRNRILKIINKLVKSVANPKNSRDLAKNLMKILTQTGYKEPDEFLFGMKAVYLASQGYDPPALPIDQENEPR